MIEPLSSIGLYVTGPCGWLYMTCMFAPVLWTFFLSLLYYVGLWPLIKRDDKKKKHVTRAGSVQKKSMLLELNTPILFANLLKHVELFYSMDEPILISLADLGCH